MKGKPTQEEIARSRTIATADAFFAIFGYKRIAIVEDNVITPNWEENNEYDYSNKNRH